MVETLTNMKCADRCNSGDIGRMQECCCFAVTVCGAIANTTKIIKKNSAASSNLKAWRFASKLAALALPLTKSKILSRDRSEPSPMHEITFRVTEIGAP